MRRLVATVSLALLAYAQVGYGPLLWLLLRLRGERPVVDGPAPAGAITVVVAAHDEAPVIAGKVHNALALDWPREHLEVIVAADGCRDATVERAREAGADQVLDLPRGGKIRAQDAAVRAARGEFVAFSDANALWEPDALRQLVEPFKDPAVGYVCGQVSFVNPEGGDNQEGVYWRYEMWLRELESRWAGVTGGNGAIYATRRTAYVEVDPVMGHDLSFPFTLTKNGWRCVYVPGARATEKMVPSIEGEWRRKRRMMSHAWPIVLRGGLLDPRGYDARYGLAIASHRVLRYASPFLHIAALRASRGWIRGAQLALLAAAVAGGSVQARPFKLARYYVLTTASIAAGLADHLRHGTEAGWDAPEGTR